MDRRHFILACAALGLVACDGQPLFLTTDVSGATYGPGLRLRDQHGRMRTLADFRGKVVTVFFGYTNCPDVCPTSLALLQEVRRLLGSDAARIQVLFVTVDPARDTPERLAMYMNAFDPEFLGLWGTEDEISAVAREFHVVHEKKGDVAGGRYTIDHTAGCFIFDPLGRPRLFARHGETAPRIATDLRRLLAGA